MPADETVPTKCSDTSNLELRTAVPGDASAIWDLVRDTPALDTNSSYAYLILCDHFRDTCCVAKIEGRLAGFVTAFIPPQQPHVVFVWQVAVADWAQKQGIAGKLLQTLVRSLRDRGITHLHATITPSNRASQQLFTAFALRMDAAITSDAYYSPSDLGDPSHEAEHLYRIGPFRTGLNHTEE